MTTKYTETVELTDQELESYLDVALSAKTVTPEERKKLTPLLKYYAKKPKPFTACVKDNRKRFGPKTEAYCAVIKDLIMGTTKWRNQRKGLSENTLNELFALSIDDGFFPFISELELSEIDEIVEPEAEESKEEFDFSDDSDQLLAEMYFADEAAGSETPDEEGLIWKPILRAGTWKYSPGGGAQATPKPITVIKDGKSDKNNLVISMSELKENFEAGAVEHVTIPTSHADNVLENTGFIKKLRFGVDSEGRDILEAAHQFADPEVKEKAIQGTIANTSAGILFDWIHKETGKKFRSVLAHVALTNRPWLNGMKPFGVNASDTVEVVGFSEEPINDDPAKVGGGGTSMSDVTFDFTSLGFSSEDELKSALEERATLKARERERDVADLCQKWQGEGKTPALVAEAKEIMMSDEGGNVVNLSEDGKTVSLSASDIVKRLVEKSTSVKLNQDPITDKDLSLDKPDDEEEVELSQDERRIATQLFFGGLSETEAVAEAKRRIAAESK